MKKTVPHIVISWNEQEPMNREAELIVHGTVKYCGYLRGDAATGDLPTGLRVIESILGKPLALRVNRELILAGRSPERSGRVEFNA